MSSFTTTPPIFWFVLLLSAGLGACSSAGGQTGGEVTSEPVEPIRGFKACSEESTLDPTDLASEVGWVQDALRAFGDPEPVAFTWGNPAGQAELTFTPDESTELQLRLSATPGPNVLVSEDVKGKCVTTLSVPVEVTLSTLGGALAESAFGTLAVVSMTRAGLSLVIPASQVTGTLGPQGLGDAAQGAELVGDITLTTTTSFGELRLQGPLRGNGSRVSVGVLRW